MPVRTRLRSNPRLQQPRTGQGSLRARVSASRRGTHLSDGCNSPTENLAQGGCHRSRTQAPRLRGQTAVSDEHLQHEQIPRDLQGPSLAYSPSDGVCPGDAPPVQGGAPTAVQEARHRPDWIVEKQRMLDVEHEMVSDNLPFRTGGRELEYVGLHGDARRSLSAQEIKSSGHSLWHLVRSDDACIFHPIQAVTAMDGRHEVWDMSLDAHFRLRDRGKSSCLQRGLLCGRLWEGDYCSAVPGMLLHLDVMTSGFSCCC